MPKALIMAGGTGGHIFPGLAVAEELRSREWQVEWMGTQDRMEAELVPRYNLPIHFVNIKGIRGKGIVSKLLSPFRLFSALMHARHLIKAIKPDLVIGMGGYASGPGGLATRSLGLPLIVHEQNAIFGMTNKFLAKFADAVVTGFDFSEAQKKSQAPANCLWLGNPVRKAFFDIAQVKRDKQDKVNILVTGGSLGAQALNQEVPKQINEFAQDYAISIKHQAGKNKSNTVADYDPQMDAQIFEFIDDLAKELAWADIVICRAGALTVSEVAAAGRVAIFIPLPIAVDDHQTVNARALVNRDAAFIVQQVDLQTQLGKQLSLLLSNPRLHYEMSMNARNYAKDNASEDIADLCEQLLSTSTHKRRGVKS